VCLGYLPNRRLAITISEQVPWQQRTKIDVLEEGQVQGCANGVGLALVKHNMAAVVALLDRLKDVGRVVLALAIARHVASLGALGRSWERLAGVLGTDGEAGPLGRDTTREHIVRRRRCCQDSRSLEQRNGEAG
jgi:hypothetical protein